MKNYFFFLLFLTGLLSCNYSTDLSVPESSKGADKFSRVFIGYIINGQADSCFTMIEQKQLNDNETNRINNVIRNISGTKLLNIKFLECTASFTKSLTTSGKSAFAIHRLAYECQFDKGYILFTTVVQEKDGKMLLTSFEGQFLKAPISELTKFTLEGRPFKFYLVLIFMALVPLFIVVTIFAMFISKISIKKKLFWVFIILFLNVIRFSINWYTGAIGFDLINVNPMGGFFASRGGLSPWVLGFHIPLGAILFWFKREDLLSKKINLNIDQQVTNEISNSNNMTLNEQ